ncbi:hypothetical protein DPX16_22959 [Anabarilius grahami]|uniref:Uncharacterized protein n=1 Tax=Anabarilius grahami TaxID=495550 RepID=A0A3N0Y5X8_ANAGA|nr:hypothetical protein DPX16_22959 [Anabarilius grahami]
MFIRTTVTYDVPSHVRKEAVCVLSQNMSSFYRTVFTPCAFEVWYSLPVLALNTLSYSPTLWGELLIAALLAGISCTGADLCGLFPEINAISGMPRSPTLYVAACEIILVSHTSSKAFER